MRTSEQRKIRIITIRRSKDEFRGSNTLKMISSFVTKNIDPAISSTSIEPMAAAQNAGPNGASDRLNAVIGSVDGALHLVPNFKND